MEEIKRRRTKLAKDYLQRIKIVDSMIENRKKELERIEDSLISISASAGGSDKIQASKSNDKLGDGVARLVDMRNDINKMILINWERRDKAIELIHKINNDDYITILYKRYVEYKKWEVIAVEKNYSMQWVLELHGRALEEVGRMLEDGSN